MEHLTFKAAEIDAGKRLDAFLSERVENWSRSRLQKLIDDGEVSVNDAAAKSSYKVRAGDEIEIELVAPKIESFEPEDIALDIIYEDEHLIVVNKPAGMVVHPGAGISSGTLANALAYKFKVQSSKFKVQGYSDEAKRM